MGEVASRALGVARHRAYRLLGTHQSMPLSMVINALCEEVERRRTVDLEHARTVAEQAYFRATREGLAGPDARTMAVVALLHDLNITLRIDVEREQS